MLKRPDLEEFPVYMRSYVQLIPEGDIIQILNGQMASTQEIFSAVTEKQAEYRYAEGKWTLSEVLGHLTDTERIMNYRILRIARGDKSPLMGFDENEYVQEASFNERPIADLLEDYQNVRRATISLLKGLPQKSLQNKGNANGFEVTVETIAYMIAGHELHHIKIIQEKYLKD
ncbi:DinB family protein [Mesobacillus sp. AQ2]|uniref:DinB family protein n=1 Tax=Bacillaceae TaxID=186817 RepID=UPI0011A9369C|nr:MULTISPECIES: DinB family protein [Bacillaceae]MCM3123209.1 DinB family protein [Mesobacillus sp. MER 33]MCM3233308.1 DinB family protein [Mesobacillus sp. MER 48]WHX42366.1 DinB family protein [Mesobacillus sp. AQ2]